MLHAEAGASAHLAFSRDVSAGELSDLVTRQDTAALLAGAQGLRPGRQRG